MKELEFEKQIIVRLCNGKVYSLAEAENRLAAGLPARSALWEYRPDLNTEDKLWLNFKEIIECNNHGKLHGKPLSDAEFFQVKQEILKIKTPYEAGQFLYGVNGVSQVSIQMDDNRTVFLTIFDQKQVGGGNTCYQVVNQVKRGANANSASQARFDITLLINGLPLIQIEEKASGISADHALQQIHQYQHKGHYNGIYSMLQVLVAMTPHSIRYMANCPAEQFNTDFAFQWQKLLPLGSQEPANITDWQTFTDTFLSIPMAHRMATNYMILDGTPNKQKLIVMRPYQVYATQAVLRSINNTGFGNGINKGGYVWHTTGSGKTITSFKTAWLAKNLPNVDKVVFLVDRKSLTRQTIDKYRAYDPDAAGTTASTANTILDTKNTSELANRLKSNGRDIVVTSTQKMMRLAKKHGYIPPRKNILFIVDEAHRSTQGESFEEIQKMFPSSLFVGYTGTPSFERDAAGKTTKDIFGEPLHAYTIREAISDKNVLGFNVSFKTPLRTDVIKEKLSERYKQTHPDWSEKRILEETEKEIPEGLDDTLGASFYDENKEHVSLVVKEILDNWENRSVGRKYNAMLTTHVSGNNASTPMAAMYYQEFKRQMEERKKEDPYYVPLKIALSYTWNNTNDSAMYKSNYVLEEAMKDYSAMFNGVYNETNMEEYFDDVISRLNRSAYDQEFLDLVIVVDQLLTGFDAPQLNTLYVDRTLKGKLLVQAYSRTNRIDKMLDKPFGRIVNYRFPSLNKKEMDDALAIYADPASVSKDPKNNSGGRKPRTPHEIVFPPFDETLSKAKTNLDIIKTMTYDFQDIPKSESECYSMLSTLAEFNRTVSQLKQYDYTENEDGTTEGFDPANPEDLYDKLGISADNYQKLIGSLKRKLIHKIAEIEKVPPEQVDLKMVSIKKATVNYDYLTELLNKLLQSMRKNDKTEAEKIRKKLDEYSDSIEDEAFVLRLQRAMEAIMRGLLNEENNPHMLAVASEENESDYLAVDEILELATTASENADYDDFRKRWGILNHVTNETLAKMVNSHSIGDESSWEKDILGNWVKLVGTEYQKLADKDIRSLSKIKFKNQLRTAYFALADLLRKMK